MNTAIATATTSLVDAIGDFGTELVSALETKAETSNLKSGAFTNISVGTADPTGGEDGDVYLKVATS